jgi:cyclophilin family peptidyl-prolyl cis-trans isomerase
MWSYADRAEAAGAGKLGIILTRVSRAIFTFLVAGVLAVLIAACGGGKDKSTSSKQSSTGTVVTAGESIPAGCKRVQDPGDRATEARQKRPKGRITSSTATVAIRTNCGAFTITLAVKDAPKTSASVATLVKSGFYDGLTFHRVSTDPARGPFVIQAGDPLGNGLGGPGYSVREKPPADLKYTKYTVAMAKTQSEPAGTSGSQFFVVTAKDAGLPADYALVGTVTDGQDTIDRIAKVPANGNEEPIIPIVISKATLAGTLSSGT